MRAPSGAKSLLLLTVTIAISLAAQDSRNSCPKGFHTLYSYRATTLDAAFEHPVVVASPDHKKTLSIRTVKDSRDPDGLHISYTVRIGNRTFNTKLLGFNGEVAWSPDSKAFATTQTEGGGSLGSRVYVFFVDETGMKKLDVARPIEEDFGTPVKCDVKVPPNTGFIRWGNDASTLLVAAEVVPVSVCACMGTYRVYEMALPPVTIVHTYSQTEAKKRFWSDLGCELRDADDKCVQAIERYARRNHRGH
jgi:hypothetical protein